MRIATKLALLLLAASLLPLAVFGLVSLWQVRQATVVSVTEGNANVSRRAADEIDQYVRNALTILESTAETMSQTDLQGRQQERILKNYINRFDEFNEISLWDADGRPLATSRLETSSSGPKLVGGPAAFQQALKGVTALSPVFIKEDLTPAMMAAAPVRRLAEVSGVLIAELNLLQMWYLVDGIRIAKTGILHVLDAQGRLIASGDGERKKDVFRQKRFEPRGEIEAIFGPGGKVFRNPAGVKVLAVGTKLKPPLSWSVIVEQPTAEAYALAARISYLLAAIMAGMILVALGLGIHGGRRNVVDPIRLLTRATEELARGNLAYRVTVATGDEFERLANAFNSMSRDLKRLQEKLIIEERHALFGRIAAGLAHDLKHPIQAIETSSRLMERLYGDAEFRRTFQQTVKREFEKINRFLEDLHRLTHDIPFHPIPLKASQVVEDALNTFRLEAERRNVQIVTQSEKADDAWVHGDPHSLNRVFCNLIANALDAMSAMEGGGSLSIRTVANGASLRFTIQDTGGGVPQERLATLFDDFVTTKSKGLGLGLALVKKIVGQHRGEIRVASEPGHGTTMTLIFPSEGPSGLHI